jgi:hypothetical protein
MSQFGVDKARSRDEEDVRDVLANVLFQARQADNPVTITQRHSPKLSGRSYTTLISVGNILSAQQVSKSVNAVFLCLGARMRPAFRSKVRHLHVSLRSHYRWSPLCSVQ